MRILVIEDEKGIRDFLKMSLEQEAYAVDTAEDGISGSRLARMYNYDLILLDSILPGKTGMEVCKELRQIGKAMPILVISVRSDVPSKVAFLREGADDYLVKPFSLDELYERVKALLRRPRQIVGNVFEVGDLALDTRTQRVTIAGEKIHLTPIEYALLRYLLDNSGQILSRTMIIENVWDMNADPFSNTLETHIKRLRHKIGDQHGELIKNVSKRGYKIEAPVTNHW